MVSPEYLANVPFIPARWYTLVSSGRHVQFIVMHSMEAPEKGTTAEGVANYFKNGSGGRKASAHYCVDNNSIIQCVQTVNVAYGAQGLNHNGIHIELAGYARQTKEEWSDEYSTQVLKNAAMLCGRILVPKWNIPVVFCTHTMLKVATDDTSVKGFTTHHEGSLAFHPGGHTDPGPGFPMDQFLEWVKEAKKGTLKG